MVLAKITVTSGIYRLVLVLHILSAIVGFGAVLLNGIYADEIKKHQGPEGIAIFDANWRASVKWGEKFIYAVPIFGLALVGMSDKVIKFSHTWVWLALVLYVIALGIVHGIHLPNLRRMRALMGELAAMGPPPAGTQSAGPPPQVAEIERRGQTANMLGMLLSLFVVAILVLMVFKPGGPRF